VEGRNKTRQDNLKAILEKARKRFPRSPDITLRLAEAMNPYSDLSGDHLLMRRAIRLYEGAGSFTEAEQVRSKLASDLFYDGVEAMNHDDSYAERQFKKAIRIHPIHADSRVHLGMIYEDRGDWKLALKSYLQGTHYGRIACHETEVWNRLLSANCKDFPNPFETHYWGELDTRPFLRGLYCLSRILYRQHRFGHALRHAQESLYLNPNDNTGIRYIAYSILRFQEKAEGLGSLKERYQGEDLDSEADRLERQAFGCTLKGSGKKN